MFIQGFLLNYQPQILHIEKLKVHYVIHKFHWIELMEP